MRDILRRFGPPVGGAIAMALGALWPWGGGGDDVEPPEPIQVDGAYLALGDSYSAGEGLEPYHGDTDVDGNRCHRSDLAYGRLLGRDLDELLVFRACSGAELDHISSTAQPNGGDRVQTADLPTDAALATITISGNDLHFSDIVGFCARNLSCLDDDDWPAFIGVDDPDLATWADRALVALEPRLTRFYAELRDLLPDGTRIVVLGYPLLFSERPNASGQGQCALYRIAFGGDEREALRSLGRRFNTVIARHAIAAGLEYVEIADAFAGHETCGRDGQWLGFLGTTSGDVEAQLDRIALGGFHPSNFHPTEDGQAMMARLVACYVDAHPLDGDPPYSAAQREAAAGATDLGGVVGDVAVGRAGDAVHECAVDDG